MVIIYIHFPEHCTTIEMISLSILSKNIYQGFQGGKELLETLCFLYKKTGKAIIVTIGYLKF